jgi:4-amino-4-deoxy-L-arabinose transferase-like glycosyltransferase
MRTWIARPAAAAILVAAVAFVLYRSTLLPDLEFGDSASFQTMGGSSVITPRDAYPLYYALAGIVVPLFDSRAHAMNMLSAIEAALACGVIALVAVELSGSVLAALAAGLLFAGSYTFWSQAVIAEVYALHILCVALTLLLLLRWEKQPTDRRLALFFAVYALAFGNHLSMILLAPAYALFLLGAAPGGWRSMLSVRVVSMAVLLAALGALQYAWNLSALWRTDAPPQVADALRTFWFDVTKSDWRDTMVLEVPAVMAGERARMYLFDLRQQFGWAVPLAAALGLVQLARANWRRAAVLMGIFAVTAAFAFGYNVGDAHVFFLPSHLVVALLVAPGIVALEKGSGRFFGRRSVDKSTRPHFFLIAVALASWNIYRNYPALDRSGDIRPTAALTALAADLDDHHAVLLTDLNWQVQNGLTYFGNHVRPDLLYTRLMDVLLYAPALVRDNLAAGRDVVVTERGTQQLEVAYGPLFHLRRDDRVVVTGLDDLARDLPPGTRYVMCVLKPAREFALDSAALGRTVQHLTGGHGTPAGEDYFAVAGLIGDAPKLVRGASRPFRDRVTLDGVTVDIRMESWLAFDTIRRMGFGHVVANRHHALIVERGVSLVAIDADGRAVHTAYAAGIFAPQPRYLVQLRP